MSVVPESVLIARHPPRGGVDHRDRTIGDQRLHRAVVVDARGRHRPQLSTAEHIGHRIGAGDGEAR